MCRSVLCCFLAAIWLCLPACRKAAEAPAPPAALVRPPVPALDVPFETVTFDIGTAYAMRLPSGSEVVVPPGAFISATGQPVNGDVELRYREMHTAADVWCSGIPMAYDSGGTRHQLQTAGMFEVRAYQGGQPLALAPGQVLEVKLASFVEGPYNFYRLDEDSTRTWQYLGSRPPVGNPERDALLRSLRTMQPGRKFPLDPRYFAFDYMAALDVFFKNEYVRIKSPESGPAFNAQAAGYGLRCLRQQAPDEVLFEGNPYRADLMVWEKLDPVAFPAWAAEGGGASGSGRAYLVPKGGHYQLRMFSADSSRQFQARVRPVMPLAALFAFTPQQWRRDYSAAMAQVVADQARIRRIASVFRTFEVAALGIHNWDILSKGNDALMVQAEFPGLGQALAGGREVWLLPGRVRSVVRFAEADWGAFRCAPDSGACILAVGAGGQVYALPARRYRQLPFDSLRARGGSARYAFALQPAQVSSRADLAALTR